jgi:hypothetical protein
LSSTSGCGDEPTNAFKLNHLNDGPVRISILTINYGGAIQQSGESNDLLLADESESNEILDTPHGAPVTGLGIVESTGWGK